MSAGPTTRPIGSVVQSCSRRCSIRSPGREAGNGVPTKPAAIRLTRTGATSSARLLVMAGRGGGGRAEGRARGGAATTDAAYEQQGSSRADPARGVPGDLQRQQEMGVDFAAGRVEVEPGQRRVAGTGAGDQQVVDRRGQRIEE